MEHLERHVPGCVDRKRGCLPDRNPIFDRDLPGGGHIQPHIIQHLQQSRPRRLQRRVRIPKDGLHRIFVAQRVRRPGLGAVEVPTSAVLARRDQFFVFIQQTDGSYKQREVKLGEQQGSHVMLLDGVKNGDLVVTQGAILLDAEANEAL